MKQNSNIDNEEREINLEENKDNKKKKFIILFVVIFVLSLITTGLTTNIFGRIGTAFRNEGSFSINDDTNDRETIRNQELRFDADSLELSESDPNGKITFTRTTIRPSEYTCETSDASIATCYVGNGYVVVNPKSAGRTTVSLHAETNGKIYEATATVIVNEADKYIELSSLNGTINLASNKRQSVAYTLIGLDGEVKAVSSDGSVASVSVSDGLVHITGLKTGTADITISIHYNGKDYTNTYSLKVVNEISNNSSTTGNVQKSGDSSLNKLEVSGVKFKFDPSITSYSVTVDEDVKTVSVDYATNSSKAKAIYTVGGIATTSLKNIPLQDGGKEIAITVIAENGKKTTYTIAINRTNSSSNPLSGITTSEGFVTPIFGDNNVLNSYNVKLEAGVDKLDLTAELADSDSSIKYIIDNTVVGETNVLKDLEVKVGKNTIKVVITNKHGINMIYFINVEREGLSNNTNLGSVEVKGYEVTVDPDKDNTYKVVGGFPYSEDSVSLSTTCEDSNCSNISYKIVYADGTTVDNIDINNIPLKEGMNTIAITVTAEDEKTQETHYVNIYRPIRTIRFIENEDPILVENSPYSIKFEVVEEAEDGTLSIVSDYASEDFKVDFSKYSNDFNYVISTGYEGLVTLTPKNNVESSLLKEENGIDLTLTYNNGAETVTTLKFDIKDYILSASDRYDMSLVNGSAERSIVLTTNLFNGDIKVVKSDGKEIKLCSEDEVYCVELKVDSNNDDADVEISYDNSDENKGEMSLPIKITAKGDGTSTLKVVGTVFGKSIAKELEIDIVVTKKYTVDLYAKYTKDGKEINGLFNKFTTVYSFEIDPTDEIELSKYSKPYWIDENCEYHESIGYSETKSKDDISYVLDDVIKDLSIEKLEKGIILYAVYDDTPTEDVPPEEKELWLVDVPLFHNEEYYSRYNEDNVIYPGANGSYIMNFKNESSDNIVITGLTLKEKTICVSNGCLNMGYIIKISDGTKETNFDSLKSNPYYYGESDNAYWILNQFYDKMNVGGTREINFTDENDSSKDRSIIMPPDSEIAISIFWKWVEIDDESDKVDTAIGNKAYEDNSPTPEYNLSVGIKFNTEKISCTQ